MAPADATQCPRAPPVCCADPRGPEHEPTPDEHRSPQPPAHATRSPQPAGTDARRARGNARGHPGPMPASRAGRPPRRSGASRSRWSSWPASLLAVLTSWPLVLHLSSRIAPDLGDPVRTAWEIAWVGHAMLHDPLHTLRLQRLLSPPVQPRLLRLAARLRPGGVLRLVAPSPRSSATTCCSCGRGRSASSAPTCSRASSGSAGWEAPPPDVAFAYAPYRVTEAGHLHVISSGGLALGVFLLLRGYRRGSRKLVLAGWLVSAWQVSLGFTLGLQYAYLLLVLALLVLVHWWCGRLTPGAAWRPSEERSRPGPAGASSPARTATPNRRNCADPLARAADPPPAAGRHADRRRRARRRHRLPGASRT